jgi:anti-anti-sigma regulatory factor
MTDERLEPGGEILIRVDGTFDARAAWDVRGRLGAIPATSSVVIDFSQVREFDDLGVAVMATGLAPGTGPHVVVRGLRQHQHRMFRYFGVDLDAMRKASARAAASTERNRTV